MALMILLAILLGDLEKRKIERRYGKIEIAAVLENHVDENKGESIQYSLTRPKFFWLNVLLTTAVIVVLVWGVIPAGFVFKIGLSVALVINYPNVLYQTERIRAHAPNALTMASIILAAGSFLGILSGTGM